MAAHQSNQRHIIKSFSRNGSHRQRCDNSRIPMAPKGIKTSKLFERKSKAKLVEWKSRESSRRTRYIPVEIVTSESPSRQAARRSTVGMGIVDEAVSHDADPQPMDVDEPFWKDDNVPEQTRVSSPSCPLLISFHWLLVSAYLHRRVYSSDWSLPELPPPIRRCSGSNNVPELHVCPI